MNDVFTIGSKPISETDEQKKEKQEEEIRKAAERIVKQRFNTQFQQVLSEIKKGKTLSTIISEVNNKESRMTRSARDFVLNFKENRIQEWIDDEINK